MQTLEVQAAAQRAAAADAQAQKSPHCGLLFGEAS
jgi:hypothetical protein